MFNIVKRQLLGRRMRQLISQATEHIYSEQSDNISTLLTSLSGGTGGIDLARAYIAIHIAARLVDPLSDSDVDNAVQQLQEAERYLVRQCSISCVTTCQ